MANEFDILDAIEEFEDVHEERWGQYEIIGASGDRKNRYHVYDLDNDKYIDIRRCSKLLSDFAVILAKHGFQIAKPPGPSRLEKRKRPLETFKVQIAHSNVEDGYDKAEEDIRSRFGQYITRISISDDHEGKPHFKFSYMGNPSEEKRIEIKEYIISTYQS